MSQSFIPWIDATPSGQERAGEDVRFKEHDTRDELGLSPIRNAFADLFFPGTRILHTRARYFLFVPWLYLALEADQVPSSQAAARLKAAEVRLLAALRAVGEEGVIGQVAGAGLQRFPSAIYWTGLRRWGIVRQPGTRDGYHRALDAFYERRQHRLTFAAGGPASGWGGTNWDPALPLAPDGFPDQATFALARGEARYLRERILLSCRGSLLATLVDAGRPVASAAQLWHLPGLAELPPEQQRWIGHARDFSLCMYGAVLLYNLMLAELRRDDELIAGHRARLAAWQSVLEPSWASLLAWDHAGFWQLVKSIGRVPWPAECFVRDWLDLLLAPPAASDLAASAPARALVRAREIALKRGRSRFESLGHLVTWSGAAGLIPLDYRWPAARTLLADIQRGLEA